jgi:hypothetical protein
MQKITNDKMTQELCSNLKNDLLDKKKKFDLKFILLIVGVIFSTFMMFRAMQN